MVLLLQGYIGASDAEAVELSPLRPSIDAILQVHDQDLETAKNGTIQIPQGVAPELRISMEDAEMRHARKSKSKRFDGYEEHIARDLDFNAIVACAVTPANRPEEEGAAPIAQDIRRQKLPGQSHLPCRLTAHKLQQELSVQCGTQSAVLDAHFAIGFLE